MVDEWDPLHQELRQCRILDDPADADSGEEYFRESPIGLARYVRPHHQARHRLEVEELDPVEGMMMGEPGEKVKKNKHTMQKLKWRCRQISCWSVPLFFQGLRIQRWLHYQFQLDKNYQNKFLKNE